MGGWFMGLLSWMLPNDPAFEQQQWQLQVLQNVKVEDLDLQVQGLVKQIFQGSRNYPRLQKWLNDQATIPDWDIFAIFRF